MSKSNGSRSSELQVGKRFDNKVSTDQAIFLAKRGIEEQTTGLVHSMRRQARGVVSGLRTKLQTALPIEYTDLDLELTSDMTSRFLSEQEEWVITHVNPKHLAKVKMATNNPKKKRRDFTKNRRPNRGMSRGKADKKRNQGHVQHGRIKDNNEMPKPSGPSQEEKEREFEEVTLTWLSLLRRLEYIRKQEELFERSAMRLEQSLEQCRSTRSELQTMRAKRDMERQRERFLTLDNTLYDAMTRASLKRQEVKATLEDQHETSVLGRVTKGDTKRREIKFEIPGHSSMPAFKGVMMIEEGEDIAGILRTLGKRMRETGEVEELILDHLYRDEPLDAEGYSLSAIINDQIRLLAPMYSAESVVVRGYSTVVERVAEQLEGRTFTSGIEARDIVAQLLKENAEAGFLPTRANIKKQCLEEEMAGLEEVGKAAPSSVKEAAAKIMRDSRDVSEKWIRTTAQRLGGVFEAILDALRADTTIMMPEESVAHAFECVATQRYSSTDVRDALIANALITWKNLAKQFLALCLPTGVQSEEVEKAAAEDKEGKHPLPFSLMNSIYKYLLHTHRIPTGDDGRMRSTNMKEIGAYLEATESQIPSKMNMLAEGWTKMNAQIDKIGCDYLGGVESRITFFNIVLDAKPGTPQEMEPHIGAIINVIKQAIQPKSQIENKPAPQPTPAEQVELDHANSALDAATNELIDALIA